MKTIHLIATTLFSLFSVFSFGLGLPITVIDYQTKEPIEGAFIRTIDKSYEVFTDEKGRANVKVPSDELLLIGADNYVDRTFYFREMSRGGLRVIELERHLIEIPGMTVLGYSNSSERRKDAANRVRLINNKEIEKLNPQTSADLLTHAGAFVQKSQMGGGSPIIRGFEANKLLIVIDGVRLNNAIYRSGHLQNVITIDNAVLDRTEIIQGPASVIYGSDALGGVIHFITKDPKLALGRTQDEIQEGNFYIRHSTANQEKAVHFDFNYGTKKLALLSSITFSDFGDLRMGTRGMDDYPGYGLRTFYVERFNGKDTVLSNPNPNVQVGTAYWQADFLQKVKYQYSKKLSFGFNFQFSTTNDVPRYDELSIFSIEDNDTIPKFATWNYGPQQRFFGSLNARYVPDDAKYYDELNVILSAQKVDEDRIKRRLNKEVEENQNEDVYVFALNGDFTKEFNPKKRQRLIYGTELIFNQVASSSFINYVDEDIIQVGGTPTRYPNGGSSMFTASLFANYRQNLTNKLSVMAGGRVTETYLKSIFLDDGFVNLPTDTISFNRVQFTASVSSQYKITDDLIIDGVLATAFRTPNVDDIGKVRSNGGYVTVPNEGLQPEKSINAEVTLTQKFEERFLLSGTYYYSYLRDIIVRDYFSLIDPLTDEPTDLLYIDGSFDTIQANVNSGQAFINGFSASVDWNILDNLQLTSSINFVKGRDITKEQPLAHIPPTYGQTALTYKNKKVECTILSRYNGWKRIEDYAPLGSSDNVEYATPDGTPSWVIFNAYIRYEINHKWSANLACENITDRLYRPFSSGVSAPGRNFIFTVRNRF